MRLVERPSFRPQRCAAVPFIGAHTPNTRWVDTGSTMDGFENRIYLSESGVREAAYLLGFPTPGDFQEACADRDEAQEQVERLVGELAEARVLLEAVETVKAAGIAVGEAA